MPNQVPEPIKVLRSERLLELEKKLRTEYLTKMLGKEEEILTEDKIVVDGRKFRSGYSKCYIRYILDDKNVGENVVVTGIADKLSGEDCICLK